MSSATVVYCATTCGTITQQRCWVSGGECELPVGGLWKPDAVEREVDMLAAAFLLYQPPDPVTSTEPPCRQLVSQGNIRE